MDKAGIKSALAAVGLDVPSDVMEELAVWARALRKLVEAYNGHQPVYLEADEVKVLTEGMHQMLEELGIS